MTLAVPSSPAGIATLRWAININAWQPDTQEWQFLLDLLKPEEREAPDKFKFEGDKKRALVSRLLQRSCVATALGVPYSDIVIKRTKGRKPFFAGQVHRPHAPNFNFNVSHEGDFVVLASEPYCICGVDVAAPQQVRRGKSQPLEDTFTSFQRQFTPYEWQVIRGCSPDEAAMEEAFRRGWSLKEAFVKVRGDGIAFELGRAEFHLNSTASSATVHVDGVLQSRWRFFLQELGNGHWTSVARGPPEAIIDAWGEFKATLQQPVISDDEFQAHLSQPTPPFSLLSIADLVPAHLRSDYEASGGDIL